MLAGQAFGDAAVWLGRGDLLGALQRLERAHGFAQAAFGQHGFDSFFEFIQVHRFFQDVMRGAWALERL